MNKVFMGLLAGAAAGCLLASTPVGWEDVGLVVGLGAFIGLLVWASS